MKRAWVLLVLVLPLAQAGPEHEAAVLGAQLDAVFRPDLSNATLLYAPTLPAADRLGEGCHEDGQFRIEPEAFAFRFEEQRDQAGCGEVRVRLEFPQTIPQVVVSFDMDRLIHQASNEGSLQLSLQVQQRLNVYDGGELRSSINLFGASHPHEPIPQRFDVVLNTADLGPSFVLGWYFEDTGRADAALTGSATGRQVISTVRDIQVGVFDVALPLVQKATIDQRTGPDAVLETVRADLRLAAGWASADTVVSIDHLDTVAFEGVTLPNGTRLSSDDLPRLIDGGRGTVLLEDEAASQGGVYQVFFQGRSALPVVPAGPPTRLDWLVWTALAVPVVGLVGATWNQALLARDGIRSQRGAIYRKHVELVLLVIGHVALTVLILRRFFDDLAVLPLGRIAFLFYGLLGVLLIGYLLHWGIGVLRRRHARDLRQAEALRKINEDLARSNRDLERFAYVASHDLQEPLRKVMSFTGLLQKRYGGALDDRASGYIDQANDAAARARALITDLLAFSRVGSSEPTRPVDLSKVVQDVLKDLDDDVRASKARIDVGDLPTVPGSEGLLRQLFTNLIGNAIKYRDPARPLQVEVRARQEGRHWRVAVTDNGLGIDEKHQDKVFEIFQRVHTDVQGSGIGLAICKRIAEFHGGTIALRSAAGEGATFSVLLPMKTRVAE